MYNGKKIVALIPARGGSKRLPNKNIMDFYGKPLIHWTIKSALETTYIDDVYTSTDSEKIANIARENGAKVPYLRQESTSHDTASSMEVILEFIQKINDFDILVLLQPTSPLRNSSHIQKSIEYFFEKEAKGVVSVTKSSIKKEWLKPLGKEMSLDNFLSETSKTKRSQDLPEYYYPNGAIYIQDKESLIKHNTLYLEKGSFGFELPVDCSIDIDEKEDFELAQYYFKKYRSK